jgi:hypothetical protein
MSQCTPSTTIIKKIKNLGVDSSEGIEVTQQITTWSYSNGQGMQIFWD